MLEIAEEQVFGLGRGVERQECEFPETAGLISDCGFRIADWMVRRSGIETAICNPQSAIDVTRALFGRPVTRLDSEALRTTHGRMRCQAGEIGRPG